MDLGIKREINEIMGCLLDMNGFNTFTNLKILPFGSYDVVIGMDWLDAHNVVLFCLKNNFTCLDEEGNQRIVKGNPRTISIRQSTSLQLKICFRKACQLYENHVKYPTKYKGIILMEFPISTEFIDVFEEVLRFLPRRHIDFSTDLVPRASMVSKNPHQMSILGLKEFKCN